MSVARFCWLSLFCLLVHASASRAQSRSGSESEDIARTADKSLSPYFLVEDCGGCVLEPFALESTRVHAAISGVIADVTVQQTYRNGGLLPISARYVFPASTRAAVHALQFELEGRRRVVASIKPREQAAREYRAAAESGKTATLLEQDRPNVFTMAVSNILPGDHVVVELHYSELLVPTDGTYSFVYPTVVGPRYRRVQQQAQATPVLTTHMPEGELPDTQFSLNVILTAGLPIAELNSATHDLDVVWQQERRVARVSLAKTARYAGDRDFIFNYRLRGDQIQSGLMLYEGEQENHFLLMVQPPARVTVSEIPPREYIFVLDVSGSMSGFPLDTAKRLISQLIAQLRPTDTFNVLLFSGDSQLLSPASLAATQDHVQQALALIDRQRGGGGTELEAALSRALELPRSEHVSRSVVVLTDGYITEERGAFELVAREVQHSNVFAFGIGSSVNRHLIEGLAHAGQGEPFVVTDAAHAAETAERFRRYIESPVLTEVRVRFEQLDVYDVEPAVQADLFAERPIVVFGKWRGPRAGRVVVAGQRPSGEFQTDVQVAHVTPQADNAALPRLWARSRIAHLTDFTGGDGVSAGVEKQVTELGLRYSLLTNYTSFVAVLEEVRNAEGAAGQVDQSLPLPAGVSDLAVGGAQYQGAAEPELLWLSAIALGLLAASTLRRRLLPGGARR